jgi:hypothetical protein
MNWDTKTGGMHVEGHIRWKNRYYKFYRGILKLEMKKRPTHCAFPTLTKALNWADKVAYRWNRVKKYEQS